MNQLLEVFRLFYLLSKYRALDDIVKSNCNFFIVALYNCLTMLFYPANLFYQKKPITGECFLELCKKLGPIYIKFGQTLSTRPDLIGADLCDSLQKLQDKLEPFSFETVKMIIQKELGKNLEEVFAEFETEAIAAASVAQVHKAKLLSGQIVAVKILRPGIQKKYQQDLKTLSFLARIFLVIFPKLKKLKIKEIIQIFDDSMKLELNLRIEAANCSEITDNFSKDSDIYLPQIHWNITTENILVIEWIDGISIYNTEKLKSLGFDVKLLSQQVALMFFKQTYQDGFFHADLHPGNIFVTLDGKIALVDFGIMGRLSDKDRFAVARILHAFLTKNYMQVAQIHLQAGYIPQDTNLAVFAQHCRAICEPIIGLALKDVSINKILGQLFKVINDFGLEIQPQLILLQKSMVLIEGIGKTLNPDINMWKLAYPWMEQWAIKNISFEAKLIHKFKEFITNKLSAL
jgi:ubiquinone biosynthesis protein